MKICVIYSSKTGNTKKIALAIAAEILNCDIFSVTDNPNLENYDLVFMGYWVDKGMPDKNSMEFMKNISNKRVALFATLGDYPDTEHAKESLKKGTECLGENCQTLGCFICQGAIDPQLIEWMKTLPENHPHAPNEARLKRWKDASTRPDNDDVSQVKLFANNVLKKV